MQKIWKIQEAHPQEQRKISESLCVHPIVAQLLINREITDITEAKEFLFSDLSNTNDPQLFKGMVQFKERIELAKKRNEKVLVFGDYDVDGVTSSALLYRLLTQIGLNVINHIPHRMVHGYGLNHEIAEFAKSEGVSLLITIDCGISAHEEVDTINQIGIDVIVIDHHEPSEDRLPRAVAIINPKQKDCPYPFKHLCSVGLVAKLYQALLGEIPTDILDLVAIGTVADVVPLRGENRVFVKAGLPQIAQTKNKGLSALLEVGKIKGKKISPFMIGFVLGPRINASGRMDSAHTSLDLFLSQDDREAFELALELEEHNVARQKMQRDIVAEAFQIIDEEINFKDQKVIVLSKEGWHKGVLGIVASRITDKYFRPSIVISVKEGVGTASARSINGFHLHDALSLCADHLEAFGGHQGAAGLTIREENIDPFRNMINEIAERKLEVTKLIPSLAIDCEIALSEINLDLANIIDSMEPFGEGNPIPVFCSRAVTVRGIPQILGKDTLKFWVTDGKAIISAIGFGMGDFKPMVASGQKLDLAFQIIIDDWNKAPTPQLRLKDIRLSDV